MRGREMERSLFQTFLASFPPFENCSSFYSILFSSVSLEHGDNVSLIFLIELYKNIHNVLGLQAKEADL